MENLNSIIKSWIKYNKDPTKYSTLFWAIEKLYSYVKNNPEIAFELILLLIQESPNDRMLANIAAGPLEDFTRLHYEKYIAKIETQLRQNPSFRKCMTGVWFGSDFPIDILNIIKKYTNAVKDPL